MRGLRTLRDLCYLAGRVLGDVAALASGKPGKILRRVGNKWIGRKVVRRMWLR